MGRIMVPVLAAVLLLSAGTAAAVSVGEKAPGFTAMSNRGEVSLADFIGEKNVILAFYFAINTPA